MGGNDIKTLEQAKKFHEVNYSQKAEPQAKKPKKKGGKKQASGESNVPKWSNPDYKNETSEETKQELERKKQELLAHLEESVNK